MMRRILLGGALTAAFVLMSAGSALAAGKAVKIGTPFESGQPSVAVDSAGDSVIAWANTKDLAGATDFVQYCVIPVNGTGCSRSGSLTPADGGSHIDGVQTLVEGNTIVILADVYGTASSDTVDGTHYEPEQEWQSTDDGATFAIVNGGLSVASGTLNADTEPVGAVTVPGAGVLGYGWETAGGAPTFNAFPLSNPPECSDATNGCAAGFATLEPDTNPDTVTNGGGSFAADASGVMGVFFTDFTNGPLGCSGAKTVPFGTAYAYGSGVQSATNNYNISPGQPNSAWKVPVTLADCNVEYAAVDGGPSGFGILEDDELKGTVIYHRFINNTFITPTVTVSAAHGELDPAVSQDSEGGVYATYLSGGDGGPVSLSYSPDGGTTWSGPATLDTDSDGGIGDLTSNVNPGGQGWAAWSDNGSLYAQSFKLQDAIVPAVISNAATATKSAVKVGVTCAIVPCKVKLALTTTAKVETSASVARVLKKKPTFKTETFTIASDALTITKTSTVAVDAKLTKKGKKYLSGRHGHVRLKLTLSETIKGKTETTKRTLNVKLTELSK
jgi:hypothetical protein